MIEADVPKSWSDEPVHIVPYDSGWPARYELERALLATAVDRWADGRIHHIGSTAVPGMDAKPIIDILVGIDELEDPDVCLARLAALGYVHAPFRIEEMHWFCKPDPSKRTHHLHLVSVECPRFRDEIVFRDHLRTHPEVARDYSALKHELAKRYRFDRTSYTNAKSDFINAAVRSALAVKA